MTVENNSGLHDSFDAEPDVERSLPSASGLDEKQIAPEDIAKLQALFNAHLMEPWMYASLHHVQVESLSQGLPKGWTHEASLALATPRNLRLRLVPIPKKITTRRYGFPSPRITLHKALKTALMWPVIRRRQHVEDLPRPVQKALFEAVFRRYGADAKTMEVRAVFPHIPPEAAQSVKLGPQLEAATFAWPANQPVAKALAGHYLVVLEQADGKTRNVIFRLE